MIQIMKNLTLFFCSLLVLSGCSMNKGSMPTLTEKLDYLESWEKTNNIPIAELKSYWGNNDTANAFIQYDVDVYRITYQSKDLDGNDKLLSGAILIPTKSEANSVIAIQHATFFANTEAPSVNEGFSVVSRKSIFAAHGYIVFLPDYHGFGIDAETIHPYHHAESLTIASRDMILAGYEFLQDQAMAYNQKLFLAGYSEGAYATAALQQTLENNQDLPVKLTASSLGSGAYNLKATFEQFTSATDVLNTCLPCNAFFLQSYNEVYKMGHPMDYYFQAPYAKVISDGLLLGDYDAGAIDQQLTTNPTELFNPTFILNYFQQKENSWTNALIDNSIHEWEPAFPTLITHNELDNVSPFFNSEDLAMLNQNNAKVTFLPIPNTNHFSGIFPWGLLTMEYFDQF